MNNEEFPRAPRKAADYANTAAAMRSKVPGALLESALEIAPKVVGITKAPEPIDLPDFRNYQFADWQYEILKKTIVEFQGDLAEDEETAIQLAAFGKSVIVYVDDLGYSNPSLIHIYGSLTSGERVELIQHINQLNFLLLAQKKRDPEKPPRRIGFVVDDEDT
jgi:hypothetical protein